MLIQRELVTPTGTIPLVDGTANVPTGVYWRVSDCDPVHALLSAPVED